MLSARNSKNNPIEAAIIGAGPYGLSIAAHLKAREIDFRIIGNPMNTWRTQMPRGMRLKSEGFASSLFDPNSVLTLEQYCKDTNHPYSHFGLPVPLETFTSYGLEFQKRFVPELEEKMVVAVRKSTSGFEITLDDGQDFVAQRVVIAVGITHYAYVPPILSTLPEEFITHSSRHSNLDGFKGREVIVVGAGASALDLAALLHQAGASVQLVARTSDIHFHEPPSQKPWTPLDHLRHPRSGIGVGWDTFLTAHFPWAFHLLSEKTRLDYVRRILGPAPGWFIRDQVVGKVPFNLGVNITNAKIQNGRVSLELTDGEGLRRTLMADHVISATGYKVDIGRLTFLSSDIQAGIKSVEQTPVLSSKFESSVPGLYFVGPSSANSFGPLMRFAVGARYPARCLSKHFARLDSRKMPRTIVASPAQALDRGKS